MLLSPPFVNLAVSSWSWHWPYFQGAFSLLDLPKAARSLAFDAVECNDFMLPVPRFSRLIRPLLPTHTAALWRYRPVAIRAVRRELIRHRLDCLGWTLDTDLSVWPTGWPWQLLYVRCGALAAAACGARLLRITLGGTAESPDSCDAVMTRRLVSLARVVRSQAPKLTIVVENHGGVSARTDRLLRIISGAQRLLRNPERLGICFDPANVPQRETPVAWRELSQVALHIHFKTRSISAADPTESTLPYPAIFRELRRAGYAGAYTIEYEGEADTAATIGAAVSASADLLQHLLFNAE